MRARERERGVRVRARAGERGVRLEEKGNKRTGCELAYGLKKEDVYNQIKTQSVTNNIM